MTGSYEGYRDFIPEWFVKATAKDIIEQLSEDEKEELLKNPDYIDHHEGFGMWIRNTYIHGKDLPMMFPIMADDLSAIIFEEVIEELTGEKVE